MSDVKTINESNASPNTTDNTTTARNATIDGKNPNYTNYHNTTQRGNRRGKKKRSLIFVSEGSADIDTQKKKEEQQQKRYENERLRRKRKSLQEQLRANAIKKQREFKKLVKKRESFNKLSKQELDYFQKIRREETKRETELNNYLNDKIDDFEIKKYLLTGNKQSDTKTDHMKTTSMVKSPSVMPIGVVKKKHKKIGISLKKIEPK